MNDKLQEIKTDLAVNGKQTKEKRLVMAEFSSLCLLPTKCLNAP
jgi:hypothetical protein